MREAFRAAVGRMGPVREGATRYKILATLTARDPFSHAELEVATKKLSVLSDGPVDLDSMNGRLVFQFFEVGTEAEAWSRGFMAIHQAVLATEPAQEWVPGTLTEVRIQVEPASDA